MSLDISNPWKKHCQAFPILGKVCVVDVQRITTDSPEATRKVAAGLAAKLRPGSVLALHGELGAGKTCFIQGLAEALGAERTVTSPTYTLINEYPGRLKLNHIDFYRIRAAHDALSMGLDEYFDSDAVTAIEWAERIAPLLPERTIHIEIKPGPSANERVITIRGNHE
jgi:tRNA threonylcarbamoyladenosine biosynthesis protein TsaE